MKYIKKFEKDKYNFEIKEEIGRIIKNYNPYVVKYEDNNEYFSVLVKDKNSNFESWIDLWAENDNVSYDWNQMSYNLHDSNDMIKQGVENDPDVYQESYNVALDTLISDEMIYQDDDSCFFYHSDFWYVKDGYKEQGISLEKAKEIKKYNL